MKYYNGKKVLIMGANPETVSLVLKAKELGLYTIVTDNNPSAYAKRFCDKAYNIDAVDVDGIVQVAKEECVDGILVGVAEAIIPAYCDVCSRMGLPCYLTKDIFNIMGHKDTFKEMCRKYGVPTIEEYDYIKNDQITYPVIVKPTDSCSSKGITVCHNIDELKTGIEYAKHYSNSKTYIIEKYMNGDEVISYYVMQDGEPIFVGMCDRYTYKQSENLVQLPTCYIFPSRHIDSYMEKTDPYIKQMIKKLGLKNGSIFFQCFVDDEGIVRTYEPGYRLNGAQEHMLMSKVSGIDAKEVYINYALTGKVSEKKLADLSNPKHKQLCCKLSPLVKTGMIKNITGLEEIRKLKDVVSINPSYDEGDKVVGEGTLKQIVCRFFIVSDNNTSMKDTINRIYQLYDVLDKNGESMLIGKFNTSIIDDLY